MPELPISETNPIIVTAARGGEAADRTPASVTLFDAARIERLGVPLIPELLRLAPSVAVSTSGPAGSLTDVRIRGAEANHTLLIIDGIRANDPAAGNIPRFELLNADIFSRIELVRGPQSALWGSEAIGGIVAVEGGAEEGAHGLAEGGSFGFRRVAGGFGVAQDGFKLALGGGLQRADGIDAFDSPDGGDKDGYRNLALRGRGSVAVSDAIELGASGFALDGRSEFDGYDPLTYERADTLDHSRTRLAAGRVWGSAKGNSWNATLWASRLGSSNRNLLDGELINRTAARRDAVGGQIEARLATGAVKHRLTLAAEQEWERFRARDEVYADANQDQRRAHGSLTAEWRAEWSERLITDVALRHDAFNRFADSTTLRAGARWAVGGGISLAASYGEGIAQPTFFDLFGYYPAYFIGNPSLKPESSRGFEVSARWRLGDYEAALTLYQQRLRDEIVTLFVPDNTAVNAEGMSRREGVEVELGWNPSPAFRLSGQYALLNAKEDGARELRRPRHSGSISVDGERRRWRYGAAIAYAGARRDRSESYPYGIVGLGAYWLASGRVAYEVADGVELFGRVANAFDEHYQDVVGYRTEGRSAHAGVRVALRR